MLSCQFCVQQGKTYIVGCKLLFHNCFPRPHRGNAVKWRMRATARRPSIPRNILLPCECALKPADAVVSYNEAGASTAWYQHCRKWPFLGLQPPPRSAIYDNVDIMPYRHLPHSWAGGEISHENQCCVLTTSTFSPGSLFGSKML